VYVLTEHDTGMLRVERSAQDRPKRDHAPREKTRRRNVRALRGRLGLDTRLSRRSTLASGLALGGALAVRSAPPAFAVPPRQATPAAGTTNDPAAAVLAITRDTLAQQDLKAVIMRVTIDGEELVTTALGESMTGVPATTEMHFRNGNVAIAYMATLLLLLVDQGMVTLDDSLATWLPDIPDADSVTLRMLANMTAGYPDYVRVPDFGPAFYADPFRAWTPEELIALSLAEPRHYAPGTNWNYAHTNYVILGLVLEQITGQPLDVGLREQVLDPLGLRNTVAAETAVVPEPVLHSFTSERRELLGIPAGTPFYEESTYWNPSWTLARGAVQTTDIYDMTASAVAIGEGTLLSPASHEAQVAPDLIGFGSPLEGCPGCRTMDAFYSYGLGVVLNGSWILQRPLFGGSAGVMAYLPPRKIAIALVTTFGEGAFADDGSYRHASHIELFTAIGAALAPESPPPSA
jgi:CubicO group peptidase (beta-lactamase class C family)